MVNLNLTVRTFFTKFTRNIFDSQCPKWAEIKEGGSQFSTFVLLLHHFYINGISSDMSITTKLLQTIHYSFPFSGIPKSQERIEQYITMDLCFTWNILFLPYTTKLAHNLIFFQKESLVLHPKKLLQ